MTLPQVILLANDERYLIFYVASSEYLPEYILGKNSYRIDLLIIKKLTKQSIPKSIAHIFKTFNLFEIKGLGSSVSIDSYYKS